MFVLRVLSIGVWTCVREPAFLSLGGDVTVFVSGVLCMACLPAPASWHSVLKSAFICFRLALAREVTGRGGAEEHGAQLP